MKGPLKQIPKVSRKLWGTDEIVESDISEVAYSKQLFAD
jgi:hypothetical protein